MMNQERWCWSGNEYRMMVMKKQQSRNQFAVRCCRQSQS